MKTYKIQDKQAGNVIDKGLSQEEADKLLAKYEEQDKANGDYTPDFYEVVEDEE